MKNKQLSITLTLGLSLTLALLSTLVGGRMFISYAANITVNTTADELNNDGDCSLREAIKAANTDSAVDACLAGSGADTINLPAGTYILSINGISEDLGATGDLDIYDDLTIVGASAATTIIDGGGIDRVFDTSANFTLDGVTVRNGTADAWGGGGIRNTGQFGTINIIDSAVSYNQALNGWGGGLANDADYATINCTNSSFTYNQANQDTGGGIGIYGEETNANFDHCTICYNTAAAGGGLDYWPFGWSPDVAGGTVNITGTKICANKAITYSGGGIQNSGPVQMNITGSQIVNNTAAQSGGGIKWGEPIDIAGMAGGYIEANSVNTTTYYISSTTILTNFAASGPNLYGEPGSFVSWGYNTLGDLAGSNWVTATGDVVVKDREYVYLPIVIKN